MAFQSSHTPPILLLNLSFLMLLSLFIVVTPLSPHHTSLEGLSAEEDGCRGLEELQGHAKCSYILAHGPCVPQGYVDYLRIFYCAFGERPALGYALSALWLLVLFYLLGDTASRFFCSSLDGLSRVLRLPPTVAGITLLSLGNGAPDVFSSVVSFTASGAAEVGLSGVLGGALFVTSMVVGVVSIAVGPRAVSIDRSSFVRDIFFLILVLGFVLTISIAGRIDLWASICFFSLYVVYVLVVWAGHGGCRVRRGGGLKVPLLESVEVEDPVGVAIEATEEEGDHLMRSCSSLTTSLRWFRRVLEMPLCLPRALTIPDVSEERWSKPMAVASVALSPTLLAILWNSRNIGDMGSEDSLTMYLLGGLVGMVLGILALETTEDSHPPRRCLFPWLAGGFLMSVVWVCLIATELVSLLVSFGHILGISPAILGLTVLAWGNSLGDMMANVAMALKGGKNGVQIAISGCYAGPIFNTLVGLGLSLVLASWARYPNPFVIPQDPSLLETLGFLIAGLVWALVVLPWRGMKLNRVLGFGLLAIYFSFLCLRLSKGLGLLKLELPCLPRLKGFFYFWAIKPFDSHKGS